jgi:hypothetical protein
MKEERGKKVSLEGMEVEVLRDTEHLIPYLQEEIAFMKKYGYLKETDRVVFRYNIVKPPFKRNMLVWRDDAGFVTYNLCYIRGRYYKLYTSLGICLGITLEDNPKEFLLKMRYRDNKCDYYGRF